MNTPSTAAPAHRAANKIREVRLRLGMSQAEVARAAGLTAPSLARLEHETVSPRLSTFAKLATAMGVAIADLIVPASLGDKK